MNSKTISGLGGMIRNAVISTRAGLANLIDGGTRDIDKECGYPKTITPAQYRDIYNREGMGKRVVDIYPEACWASDPVITDGNTVKDVDTPFAKEWKQFSKKLRVPHYLHRADELSGIGSFGVIVLGIADGKQLHAPVVGVDAKGVVSGTLDYDLEYLKVYSEENIQIVSVETDVTNPRYGKPTMYKVSVSEVEASNATGGSALADFNVHYTRVIHLADNRKDSDVYGTPRMQSVYNRIYDLRKILSGAGEMFWKGGFPGLSFEALPEVQDAEIDKESLDKEVQEYYSGLRRYLALQGMTAKSLSPQIADPSNHVDSMLKIIAIAIGVPYRVFAGSEESRLASSQDARAWNKRVVTRRDKYVDPLVIMPFVDICLAYGFIKNKPKDDDYGVFWPKLDVTTEEDKANIADKTSNALAKYVSSSIEHVMPFDKFLVHVLGYSKEVATEIAEYSTKNNMPFYLEQEVSSKVAGGAAPQAGSSKSDENTRAPSTPD